MWTCPWTRITEVFKILFCCGNVASVPKAPFISYSCIKKTDAILVYGKVDYDVLRSRNKIFDLLMILGVLSSLKKSEKNSDW